MEQPLINKPQTERGKKTLNSIVNAAVQLFYEKGYFHTSISDITKLAGTGTGTFYIYFDGKYSLYKYLLLSCSRMIRKHLTKSIEGCKTRQEMERVGMKSWLEFVLSHEYIYGIIWESMYIDRKLFDDYYITFCKAYMKGLSAAPAGEIADIDLEVMAYSLMGISNFIGLNWGLFRENTSREEIDRVVNEYMKILENGIFTEKARTVMRNQKSGSKKKPQEKKMQFSFPLDFDDEDGDASPGR
ncbi:MAG: TetR/AcrR family transcriptional regulator [Lachnospiraceae bacterium]|nr:TetR/AcrR family transcriptional regulator [Lachnospiraceae bacterium]